MISYELMIYCLAAAGGWLAVISVGLEIVGRKARLDREIPEEVKETVDIPSLVINYLMELLFYVMIPTIAYTFFYLVIPLSGVTAGMAIALIAITLGAIPVLMVLSVRVRLPITYILFMLLSQMLKISGSLIIIGYLYAL